MSARPPRGAIPKPRPKPWEPCGFWLDSQLRQFGSSMSSCAKARGFGFGLICRMASRLGLRRSLSTKLACRSAAATSSSVGMDDGVEEM
eukprot:scaffold475_cov279-Pinguiococcus_pyrenoidosus.AAC.13